MLQGIAEVYLFILEVIQNKLKEPVNALQQFIALGNFGILIDLNTNNDPNLD